MHLKYGIGDDRFSIRNSSNLYYDYYLYMDKEYMICQTEQQRVENKKDRP